MYLCVMLIAVTCSPYRYQVELVHRTTTCDFRFQIFGHITPIVNIFENDFPDLSTGHRSTFRGQVWWKSVVTKFPKGSLDYHTKKLGLRGTCPNLHFGQNGPIAPNFPERCYPLTCPRMPNLVRICFVLPDLLRKNWFNTF